MKTLTTLTVAQLIETLSGYPKDTPVVVNTPSGDHWHTSLATSLDDYPEYGVVEWSEYHRQFKIVDPNEDIPEGATPVLIFG